MKVFRGVCPLLLTISAFGGGIDFDTLPGNNGDAFTSYSENGFTVLATAGAWRVATMFGNPVPDVYCAACRTGTLEITGGQFFYNSFDLGNALDSAAKYTVIGFLNGNIVVNDSGTGPSASGTFATKPSSNNTQLVDQLFISIITTTTDANIDNINLTSTGVPEPGTWVLMLTSLGGIAILYRRRGA